MGVVDVGVQRVPDAARVLALGGRESERADAGQQVMLADLERLAPVVRAAVREVDEPPGLVADGAVRVGQRVPDVRHLPGEPAG